MAWVVIDKFIENQFESGALNLDIGGDSLKVALYTSTKVPSEANDDLFNTTNEVTGTGYTSGGEAVTGQSIVLSTGTVTFDIADVVFAQNAAGFTNARFAYLYKVSGGQIIAFADLTSDRSVVGGSLTLEIDTLGVFTVT